MQIQYSALQKPKPGSRAEQCEDAFAYSSSSSAVAVCDGAGTAFESRRWARLLADGFVANPPLGWADDNLLSWVDSLAAQWSQSIPWKELNLFQEQKAQSGSAATLIGLKLAAPSRQATTGTWECLAVGDSCLFQVSDGHLVKALPLTRSADFDVHPPLLSTQRNVNVRSIGQLVADDGTWQTGDRFFLLTDAIAQWFLRECERGEAPWDFLGSLGDEPFITFVRDAQAQGLMRSDDVTVFMIGVGVPLAARTVSVPVPVQVGVQAPQANTAQPPATPVTPRPAPTRSGGAHQRSPARAGVPPAPPGHPSQVPPPPGPPSQVPPPPRPPSGAARFRRRRVTVAAAALLFVCAAIVLGLTVFRSKPPAPPPASPVPPVQPAASDFATLLTTYAGGGAAAYQQYESALSNDVVGHNPAVVSQLTGLSQVPPGSLSSRATVDSVAVVSSTRSRAELYVLVEQVVTAPYAYTTSRTCTTPADPAPHQCLEHHTSTRQTSRLLLIDLMMARQGQKWLVSSGQVSLIAPAGALSPSATSAGGNH